MQKAGGIVALIGGIFGTIGAIFTLLTGGFVAGLEGATAGLEGGIADNTASTQITEFGLMGLLFAFLTIILGAVAMGAKSKKPGFLLIICAIAGAVTGGTLVAVCMALALAGGILAMIGIKKPVGEK